MINKLIKLGEEKDITIEIVKNSSKAVVIQTYNDKLILSDTEISTTYEIKGVKGNKKALVYYEKINDIEEIVNALESIIEATDNNNETKICENDFNFNKPKINLDYNQIKNDLLSINDLKDKYPFVKNIMIYFVSWENTREIINKNHKMHDEYSSVSFEYSVSGEDNGTLKLLYDTVYGKDYSQNVLTEEIENKIKELELQLAAKSIISNKYNIILESRAVADLLAGFSSIFYDRNLYMKTSLLTDKKGTKIFSDKITIKEDPTNPRFTINKHFDSEGVITYNKDIVKDGVFTLSLNDLEYAIKNGTKPTGNADGVNNLYIKPGNKSYNELIKELNNGIIITKLEGLHTGMNTLTGDISLPASGYLVQNGKIAKALDMMILSSNIKEIFGNVIEIGSDLIETSSRYSGVSLLLNDITITGNLKEGDYE